MTGIAVVPIFFNDDNDEFYGEKSVFVNVQQIVAHDAVLK